MNSNAYRVSRFADSLQRYLLSRESDIDVNAYRVSTAIKSIYIWCTQNTRKQMFPLRGEDAWRRSPTWATFVS